MQAGPTTFEELYSFLTLVKSAHQGHTYLMVLHADPNGKSPGGTERHVNMLQNALWAAGHYVLEMFPGRGGHVYLRVRQDKQVLFVALFDQEHIRVLAPLFASCIQFLHIHHTRGWHSSVIESLMHAGFSKKVITLHDFYLLCPSIHMLKEPKEAAFCEVEQNLQACNHCLSHFHGFRRSTIELYRQQTLMLLQGMDHIIVPSSAVERYFQRALCYAWNTIIDKVLLLPHDIAYLFKIRDESTLLLPEKPPYTARIVFLGAVSLHKGYHLMVGAVRRLRQQGYQVEIWGRLLAYHPSLHNVSVRGYQSPTELRALFVEYQPALVVFPFLWAETFSYVFYEMMILSDYSIPVVGKFGHPAEVVEQTNSGVVLAEMSVAGLLRGIDQAQQQYHAFLKNKQHVVAEWMQENVTYYTHYEKLFAAFVPENNENVLEKIDVNVLRSMYAQVQSANCKTAAQCRSSIYLLWHLVKTRFRYPMHLSFYLGRGMQVLLSEGWNGVRYRVSKLLQ
ncbi:MAG: hypothetical protein A3E83_01590 [Gammaproteobacteria bacterium RIFCSPHIGHO2_12_FULL_41_20]|nr:MAG: hypothetical protein A3E83_01590 [Gammaproteobacteria bacterium RIFCSPHIGHO2_12_FULL_41_20]